MSAERLWRVGASHLFRLPYDVPFASRERSTGFRKGCETYEGVVTQKGRHNAAYENIRLSQNGYGFNVR